MVRSYYDIIRNSKPVKKMVATTKKLVLPGFDGIPLFDVILFFVKGIYKGSITVRAAALSFDFFMALFPAILFFFTLIPYIPIDGFQQTLIGLIQDTLPPNTFDEVNGTLEDIVLKKNTGWLSLSFILALVFSTNGTSAIIEAFNHTYHTIETRSYMKQRLIALFLVFVLSGILILATAMIIFGTEAIQYVYSLGWIKDSFTFYMIATLKWVVLVALIYFIFSFLYYFAPAKRKAFRFISAGSTLATILMILTSVGFDYYISNFSRYNALYGSIGTLMIILFWIYLNAIICLIGFELNASITVAKRKRFLTFKI
ncbi:MAG: YihY/virulence factor BrkB family protein [Bacteroidales bacterium]|nr:YihY/virulence factor BrkB family protein [Bacteroidales bacterium]